MRCPAAGVSAHGELDDCVCADAVLTKRVGGEDNPCPPTCVCADAVLIKRVGGKDNLHRLREIKAKYDPTNMFASHGLMGL